MAMKIDIVADRDSRALEPQERPSSGFRPYPKPEL